MKFLITFTVLLIQAVSVFSVYIKGAELVTGQAKLEPLENIYSAHIPRFLEPLNLTTGELKLFAGHTFKLIKTKCPAVSQERLDLISKYITKHISRSNPTPGTSPTFNELATSISTCTERQLTDEEKSKRDMSFFQFFFRPMQRSFQHLFSSSDSAKDSTDDSSVIMTTIAPPDAIPLDAPSESVQVNEGNDKLSSISKDNSDSEALRRTPSVSSDFAADNNVPNNPMIRIVYTTTNSADDWHPMGWLGGVFRAMSNLFSGLFGTNDASATSTETQNPVLLRAKRDIDGNAPMQPVELVQIRQPDLTENAAPTIPLKGKDAFMVLIDNMCRIYCSECMGQNQIRNFKAAAKELLQLILTDTSGIQLASKHFLDNDFLQSLNDC